MESIKGIINNVVYPKIHGFDDLEFTIFKLLDENGKIITCKGESYALSKDMNVILQGTLKNDRYGDSFNFEHLQIDLEKKEGLSNFLVFVCGEKTYLKISAHLSDHEIIDELSNGGERLLSIKGIGSSTYTKMMNIYKTNVGLEKIFSELKEVGLTFKECNVLYKKFGEEVVKKVKLNPYKLMIIEKFNFTKCDLIAKKMGYPCNSFKRLTACLSHVLLENENNGHTYIKSSNLIEKSLRLLPEVNRKEVEYAHLCMLNHKKFIEVVENGVSYTYLEKTFIKEENCRLYIKTMIENSKTQSKKDYARYLDEYQKTINIQLGKQQLEGVSNSLNNCISVITGGPGTGKTTVLAAVIHCLFKDGYSERDIALCAPTGKAARRMMESVNGSLKTDFEATTIHSLLVPNVEENGSMTDFKYNSEHKLNYKAIIVDETSMLDLDIAYSLIQALKVTTKVILVGDIEQLPPIRYGNFLRDSIESGVPTVTLLEIMRQKMDSTIIGLSVAIRDNKLTEKDCFEKKQDYCFINFDNTDYETQISKIISFFKRSVAKLDNKRLGLDQTMILTPRVGSRSASGKKEILGTKEISCRIHDAINPLIEGESQVSKNGWTFRLGSKVIMTKNIKKLGLVNGQIGYISDINMTEKTMSIDFEGEEVILSNDEIEYLNLAYAITVHKSQGSEWTNLIYLCLANSKMNKKPLVYTAITRAKKNLVICGNPNTLLSSPSNINEERRTRLLNNFK